MKYRLILLFILSFTVSMASCRPVEQGGGVPDKGEVAQNDSIMIPRPIKSVRLDGTLDVTEPFYLEFETPADVEEALSKYLRGSSLPVVGPALSDKPIFLAISEETDVPDSEEGYHLVIAKDRISIKSRAEAGLFYGIQTVLQLKSIYGNSIPTWDITDYPRFGYRGMHLDVVRHFFSKDFVKKQLKMMASLKLNRLHLHLTDDAGWRMQVTKYPLLTEKGAWRIGESWNEWQNNSDRLFGHSGDPKAYGGYFSTDDLKEIVAYAQQLHITVVPEIEMPGHSFAAIACYPELACTPNPAAPVTELCIGKESTVEFYKNVLTEVMEIFPSEYIHLGGDEYWTGYWQKCPDCQALMKKEGYTDANQLHGWLFRTMEKFLADNGRRLIGWDEMLQGGISPNATLMSWQDEKAGQAAALKGHDVIMAPGEYCYFDGCQDSPEKEFATPDSPPALWNFLTLRRVYSYDPAPLTMQGREKVKGVQACVWTEWMPNGKRVEYMIYPRLFALAEVAWSNLNERRDYDEFRERAIRICDRAKKDGYNAFDLSTEVGDRPASLQTTEHIAKGCQVEYGKPWLNDFPAAGAKSLTDGVRGTWSYRVNWQGFKDMDVTVDLGEVTAVEEVSADFMQYLDDGVCLPGKIEIDFSTDGESFRNVQTINLEGDTYKYLYRTYGWKGKDNVRYIRYRAVPSPVGSFIFSDEIVVK